jgi:hypothetical protein
MQAAVVYGKKVGRGSVSGWTDGECERAKVRMRMEMLHFLSTSMCLVLFCGIKIFELRGVS